MHPTSDWKHINRLDQILFSSWTFKLLFALVLNQLLKTLLKLLKTNHLRIVLIALLFFFVFSFIIFYCLSLCLSIRTIFLFSEYHFCLKPHIWPKKNHRMKSMRANFFPSEIPYNSTEYSQANVILQVFCSLETILCVIKKNRHRPVCVVIDFVYRCTLHIHFKRQTKNLIQGNHVEINTITTAWKW